jgi:hypothetical protein
MPPSTARVEYPPGSSSSSGGGGHHRQSSSASANSQGAAPTRSNIIEEESDDNMAYSSSLHALDTSLDDFLNISRDDYYETNHTSNHQNNHHSSNESKDQEQSQSHSHHQHTNYSTSTDNRIQVHHQNEQQRQHAYNAAALGGFVSGGEQHQPQNNPYQQHHYPTAGVPFHPASVDTASTSSSHILPPIHGAQQHLLPQSNNPSVASSLTSTNYAIGMNGGGPTSQQQQHITMDMLEKYSSLDSQNSALMGEYLAAAAAAVSSSASTTTSNGSRMAGVVPPQAATAATAAASGDPTTMSAITPTPTTNETPVYMGMGVLRRFFPSSTSAKKAVLERQQQQAASQEQTQQEEPQYHQHAPSGPTPNGQGGASGGSGGGLMSVGPYGSMNMNHHQHRYTDSTFSLPMVYSDDTADEHELNGGRGEGGQQHPHVANAHQGAYRRGGHQPHTPGGPLGEISDIEEEEEDGQSGGGGGGGMPTSSRSSSNPQAFRDSFDNDGGGGNGNYDDRLNDGQDDDDENFKVYWQRWLMLFYMSLLNLLSDWTCYSVAPISVLASEAFGEIKPTWLVTLFLCGEFYFELDFFPIHCSYSSTLQLPARWLTKKPCLYFPSPAIFAFKLNHTANALSTALEPAILSRLGLRGTIVLGAFIMLLGSLAKSGIPFLYMIQSGQPNQAWKIYLGFFLVGLSQPLYQCTPALLSNSWFPEKERTMATGVALNSNQLGIGFAFVFGTLLVSQAEDIPAYFSLMTSVSLFLLVGTILQFDDAPPTPPSGSAKIIRGTFSIPVPRFFQGNSNSTNNGNSAQRRSNTSTPPASSQPGDNTHKAEDSPEHHPRSDSGTTSGGRLPPAADGVPRQRVVSPSNSNTNEESVQEIMQSQQQQETGGDRDSDDAALWDGEEAPPQPNPHALLPVPVPYTYPPPSSNQQQALYYPQLPGMQHPEPWAVAGGALPPPYHGPYPPPPGTIPPYGMYGGGGPPPAWSHPQPPPVPSMMPYSYHQQQPPPPYGSYPPAPQQQQPQPYYGHQHAMAPGPPHAYPALPPILPGGQQQHLHLAPQHQQELHYSAVSHHSFYQQHQVSAMDGISGDYDYDNPATRQYLAGCLPPGMYSFDAGAEPIEIVSPHNVSIDILDDQFLKSVKACFARPGFIHACVAFVVSAIVINTLSTDMDYLVRLGGAGREYVGIIGGLFQLIIMFSSLVVGAYTDNTRTYYTVVIVMLVLGAFTLAQCGVRLDQDKGQELRMTLLLVAVLVGPLQPVATELGVDVAYPLSENTVLVIQQFFANLLSAVFIQFFDMAKDIGTNELNVETGTPRPEYTFSFYLLIVLHACGTVFFATFNGRYLRYEAEEGKKIQQAAAKNQRDQWKHHQQQLLHQGNTMTLGGPAGRGQSFPPPNMMSDIVGERQPLLPQHQVL